MKHYPPMICPACGANVFAGVEQDGRVDLQATGRMPICRECAELCLVDRGRLRPLDRDELESLERRGLLEEIRTVQQCVIESNLGLDPLLRLRLR